MNAFNCFCCEPHSGNDDVIPTMYAVGSPKKMQAWSEPPHDEVESKAMPRPLDSGSDSLSEPAVVTCRVTKRPGVQLGLHVDYGDGVNLRVTKVKPGLIAEWNEQHPDQKVEMGALITNINGSSGSASDLLELTQSVDTLDMIVLIP